MTLLLPYRRPLLGLPFCRNGLWLRARAVPSLDLPFADSKSLVDAITGRQLISFARAGSGAYTDSTGVLRTAGVDEPRFDHRITSTTTNLAIRSEEFDNATWLQTGLNAFGSGSAADAIAAPDGTVTGDSIEEDTSTGFHRVSQTLISGTISTGTYTASVYVKAAQRSRAYISLDDNATGEVTAGFALLTQAFNITTAGSWSGSTASIEDVGNGWFRISLTSTKGNNSSALTLHVGIAQVSVTTISYPGNGTAGLYVWGAQLVASDSKGQYVRTGAAAASFSTTESLGLLVEEQRTNLVLQSATLSTQSVTVAAVAHTLHFTGTGTVTLSGTSTAGPLVGTGTGEANRVSLTFTPTAGTLTLTVSGTVTNAQLEAGAFRTSYIPTTTAAATRNADVASITGTNFSSWYRQDEGTFYYEGTISQGLASFPWFYNASDGTTNNSIGVYQFTNGVYAGVVTGGVAATPDMSVLFSPVPGSLAKHALAVKTADSRAALNAALSAAQLNTVMPVVNTLNIGQRTTGNRMTGHIRRLTYWPQALPGQLQAITQP